MILAIDIGGTKTLIGLFTNDGSLKRSQKFPTPSSYEEFISVCSTTAKEVIGSADVEHAVVAIPGRPDRAKGIGIQFGNLPWENVPIGRDLTKALKIPVDIENDANLAGLAEAVLLPKFKRVVYVTVSTGIGIGVVQNGKLDPYMLDSEAGQIMLEHDGKLTTWEHLASGKSIFNKFGKKASDITDPQDWYIVARNIAIGLIGVISTTVPDAVVIGGGVGTHLDKFKERLEEELTLYASRVVKIPPIFKAQNPEEAVIYGCYELARQAKK